MDRSNAEDLMVALTRIGEMLNDADHVISGLPNGPEKEQSREGLADLMGTLWLRLMLPIVRDHPHLDPDKDTEWFRLQARRNPRGAEPYDDDA